MIKAILISLLFLSPVIGISGNIPTYFFKVNIELTDKKVFSGYIGDLELSMNWNSIGFTESTKKNILNVSDTNSVFFKNTLTALLDSKENISLYSNLLMVQSQFSSGVFYHQYGNRTELKKGKVLRLKVISIYTDVLSGGSILTEISKKDTNWIVDLNFVKAEVIEPKDPCGSSMYAYAELTSEAIIEIEKIKQLYLVTPTSKEEVNDKWERIESQINKLKEFRIIVTQVCQT